MKRKNTTKIWKAGILTVLVLLTTTGITNTVIASGSYEMTRDNGSGEELPGGYSGGILGYMRPQKIRVGTFKWETYGIVCAIWYMVSEEVNIDIAASGRIKFVGDSYVYSEQGYWPDTWTPHAIPRCDRIVWNAQGDARDDVEWLEFTVKLWVNGDVVDEWNTRYENQAGDIEGDMGLSIPSSQAIHSLVI